MRIGEIKTRKMARKTKVREHKRIGTSGVREHARTLPDAPMGESKGNFRSYSEWEDEVTSYLANMINATRGDAQGIVEAQDFKMQQSWTKGLSAKETAKIIDNESSQYRDNVTIDEIKNIVWEETKILRGKDYRFSDLSSNIPKGENFRIIYAKDTKNKDGFTTLSFNAQKNNYFEIQIIDVYGNVYDTVIDLAKTDISNIRKHTKKAVDSFLWRINKEGSLF